MTMHLARGFSTLNTRKPQQQKLTRAQQEKLVEEHRLYNKRMRQAGRHSERMSYEEYVDYVYGKKKISTRQEHLDPTTIKTYTPPAPRFTRETGQYASLETSSNTIPAQPAKKEYTGTLVKGIATMHKSNAVPVINQEEAESISNMRRN
jgi:hypothetical protein